MTAIENLTQSIIDNTAAVNKAAQAIAALKSVPNNDVAIQAAADAIAANTTILNNATA